MTDAVIAGERPVTCSEEDMEDGDDDQDGEATGSLAFIDAQTSKIREMFGARRDDFYIDLDEPHRIFHPGDVVKGTVNLSITKPARVQYVRLTFSGQVGASVGKQAVKSLLFQEQLVLWGEKIQRPAKSPLAVNDHNDTHEITEQDGWAIGTINSGRHLFNFEVRLPAGNLPSSIDVRPSIMSPADGLVWKGCHYVLFAMRLSAISLLRDKGEIYRSQGHPCARFD